MGITSSIAEATGAYLVAGVLFILALRGLSSQETARRGNLYGIIGMAIALVATLTVPDHPSAAFNPLVLLAIGGGGLIGAVLAARVGMTQMPELVALLHSFVGVSAVLVGFSHQLGHQLHAEAGSGLVERVEVFLDVIIGAITTTGSILAFLKLRGSVSGRPLLLPGRHLANLVMLLGIVAMAFIYGKDGETWTIGAGTAIACVLGFHLVAGIGGDGNNIRPFMEGLADHNNLRLAILQMPPGSILVAWNGTTPRRLTGGALHFAHRFSIYLRAPELNSTVGPLFSVPSSCSVE